jgi:hypothetical protein
LLSVLLAKFYSDDQLKNGAIARIEDRRGAYWLFVGRPEGKRQLGRPRGRWEDKVKIYLK